MRLPSLRNFQVFEAAARHQSFREAADSLFLTHGAVSKQVKALEEELGVELFARIGRRVVLTRAGRHLQLAMFEALKLISDTSYELRQEAKEPVSQISVTVVPSFSTRWLKARMPDFYARHPDILVELIPTISILDLSSKKISLGIRMGCGNWSGVTSKLLAEEFLFPIASAEGVDGFNGLPSSASDLLDYPLLNPYDDWGIWFKQARIDARPVLSSTTYEDSLLLLRAVEERKGIALARKWLVTDAINGGAFVRLPGPAIRAGRDYYLSYPKAEPLSQSTQLFIAWLQEKIFDADNPTI